jgi:hypothetical protein
MLGSLWSRLKGRKAKFAVSSTTPAVAASGATIEINIHEDDWGMRNLHPSAAYTEAAAELQAGIDARERNRHPSGFGWTSMHVIRPPSTNYVEAGLRLADAAAVLEPIMPRVKSFNAGLPHAMKQGKRDPLGSYDDDAWAFGFGPHCYLKLETAGEHVKAIWFDLSSAAPADTAALRASIEAIDRLAPSVIVDHFMDAIAPVADTGLVDRYFAQRRAEIDAAARWLRGARQGEDVA